MKRFPEAACKDDEFDEWNVHYHEVISKLGVFALKPSLISIGDNGKLSNGFVAQMQGVMASSNSHAEAMIVEAESINAARTQPRIDTW